MILEYLLLINLKYLLKYYLNLLRHIKYSVNLGSSIIRLFLLEIFTKI